MPGATKRALYAEDRSQHQHQHPHQQNVQQQSAHPHDTRPHSAHQHSAYQHNTYRDTTHQHSAQQHLAQQHDTQPSHQHPRQPAHPPSHSTQPSPSYPHKGEADKKQHVRVCTVAQELVDRCICSVALPVKEFNQLCQDENVTFEQKEQLRFARRQHYRRRYVKQLPQQQLKAELAELDAKTASHPHQPSQHHTAQHDSAHAQAHATANASLGPNMTPKPPFTTAFMLYLCLVELNDSNVQPTCVEIYNFFIKKWAYFTEHADDKGWRSGVRGQLSSHTCFTKIRADNGNKRTGVWVVDKAVAATALNRFESQEVRRPSLYAHLPSYVYTCARACALFLSLSLSFKHTHTQTHRGILRRVATSLPDVSMLCLFAMHAYFAPCSVRRVHMSILCLAELPSNTTPATATTDTPNAKKKATHSRIPDQTTTPHSNPPPINAAIQHPSSTACRMQRGGKP